MLLRAPKSRSSCRKMPAGHSRYKTCYSPNRVCSYRSLTFRSFNNQLIKLIEALHVVNFCQYIGTKMGNVTNKSSSGGFLKIKIFVWNPLNYPSFKKVWSFTHWNCLIFSALPGWRFLSYRFTWPRTCVADQIPLKINIRTHFQTSDTCAGNTQNSEGNEGRNEQVEVVRPVF